MNAKDEISTFLAREEIPKGTKLAWIRAKDGTYLRGELLILGQPLVTVVAKMDKKKDRKLNPIEIGPMLHVPKISREKLSHLEAFFSDVFRTLGTEAVALLLFSPYQGGMWEVVIPDQTVTGASVKYNFPEEPPPSGWFYAGTIHSHPSFGAFHSGVDDVDEFSQEGIHITIGDFDKLTQRSFAASVVIGDWRFSVDHNQLVDWVERDLLYPENWPAQVKKFQPIVPWYSYYPSRIKKWRNGRYETKKIRRGWSWRRGEQPPLLLGEGSSFQAGTPNNSDHHH